MRVGPSGVRCQGNPSEPRGTQSAGVGGLSRNRNHAGWKEGIWEGWSNTTNREVVNHANRMLHDFEIMFDELFSESGISLDRCRAFLAIVEAGGITQASEGSTSRQSQLSRQLGELETWLGAKLSCWNAVRCRNPPKRFGRAWRPPFCQWPQLHDWLRLESYRSPSWFQKAKRRCCPWSGIPPRRGSFPILIHGFQLWSKHSPGKWDAGNSNIIYSDGESVALSLSLTTGPEKADLPG